MAIVPRRIIAQTPGAQIQAALQIKIVAVLMAGAAAAAAGEIIVQRQGVNPLIPLLRRNIAARALLHTGLRNTDIKFLVLKIKVGAGIRNIGKRYAAVFRQRFQRRKGIFIQSHRFQPGKGETGRQPGIILAFFISLKSDIFARDKLLVHRDIDAIFTRCLPVAIFKA